jgi:predicted TIM-barrel fold metal-dependent hydrolase
MSTLNRRTFLQRSAAIAASGAVAQVGAMEPTEEIIDCNVSVGPWPFRHVPGDDAASLAARLKKRRVTQAWAGSFEGIFHRDIATANRNLHATCAKVEGSLLLPAGAINPTLPGWKDDLRRCAEIHGMKVLRLHPNYHGYALDDARFLELLELVTTRKMVLQITAQLEDERTQHPLVQVKPVNLKPLPAALKKVPEAQVMVLNANRAMSMTALQGCPVMLDLAMLEGVGGVENLLSDWPLNNLVFGSHAPLFYWEAARLKLQESNLSPGQLAAITRDNATRCLQG